MLGGLCGAGRPQEKCSRPLVEAGAWSLSQAGLRTCDTDRPLPRRRRAYHRRPAADHQSLTL